VLKLAHLSYKKSFIFLKTKVKKINDVIDELMAFVEVREVHTITGKKDLLVVLETKAGFSRDEETVLDVVINKIGKIKGVEDTETIIPTLSRYKWS
jgi:DNA-binding Lrp family transcriptional regulator